MKIAMVAHQLPPHHLGGVEVYTWTLARALTSQGHQVALFAPTDDHTVAGRTQTDGLLLERPWRRDPRTEPLPCAFWHTFRHRGIERSFGAFLAAWQPELVHFQHLQWVSAQLVQQCAPLPTVLTLHDYWFICANSQLVRPDGQLCDPTRPGNCAACLLTGRGLGRRSSRVLGWLIEPLLSWRDSYLRQSVSSVDLLLTPSDAAKELYIAAGIERETIRVFANGLDTSRFEAPKRHPTRDHLVFGYLGGLAWQKGVHVLIEAFNGLPVEHELRIYGPVTAFPDYVERLQSLAQHPGISFFGPVPLECVGRALEGLDYLVVPSLWPETFGMVVQEANYFGVPVIASRIGALRRIRDGVDGRLFAPGDVSELTAILVELCGDSSARGRLSQHIASGPEIQQQAADLADLYQELIGGKKRAASARALRRNAS